MNWTGLRPGVAADTVVPAPNGNLAVTGSRTKSVAAAGRVQADVDIVAAVPVTLSAW